MPRLTGYTCVTCKLQYPSHKAKKHECNYWIATCDTTAQMSIAWDRGGVLNGFRHVLFQLYQFF